MPGRLGTNSSNCKSLQNGAHPAPAKGLPAHGNGKPTEGAYPEEEAAALPRGNGRWWLLPPPPFDRGVRRE